jgi:hypothetical protein
MVEMVEMVSGPTGPRAGANLKLNRGAGCWIVNIGGEYDTARVSVAHVRWCCLSRHLRGRKLLVVMVEAEGFPTSAFKERPELCVDYMDYTPSSPAGLRLTSNPV